MSTTPQNTKSLELRDDCRSLVSLSKDQTTSVELGLTNALIP